jgi:hypothetical protein
MFRKFTVSSLSILFPSPYIERFSLSPFQWETFQNSPSSRPETRLVKFLWKVFADSDEVLCGKYRDGKVTQSADFY